VPSRKRPEPFDAANVHLHDAVRAARAANYSWASIGAILGASKNRARNSDSADARFVDIGPEGVAASSDSFRRASVA